MGHNRVRANKATYDRRAQSNPSVGYQERGKLPGAPKQPLFKRGGGQQPSRSREALAYVAECRKREEAKRLSRLARYNYMTVVNTPAVALIPATVPTKVKTLAFDGPQRLVRMG